jgi:hypothetical protein
VSYFKQRVIEKLAGPLGLIPIVAKNTDQTEIQTSRRKKKGLSNEQLLMLLLGAGALGGGALAIAKTRKPAVVNRAANP